MRFLILNRLPLSGLRFPDWLGPAHEAVLLTDAAALSPDPGERAAQLAGYAHVEVVQDYHFNPLVELRALTLHARSRFDRVIALSEFDLLRAARLRGLFGVPGQDVRSATAFRDKVRMKELLRASDIPVADHAPAVSFADVHRFVEEQGYPVVVKPRRGGGSVGVHVLGNPQDLRDLLEACPELGTDDGAQLMCERYVKHELFHVDGIFVNGEAKLMWPSSQGDSSCLDIIAGLSLRSALLDSEDPLLDPLLDLTRRALTALPMPDSFLFHAEVFLTQDGGLLFNEVASRMGGGLIDQMVTLGFGITMPEVLVRSLADNEPAPVPPRPLTSAGLSLFPPRAGTLVRIPEDCPVPGVVAYQRHAESGTVLVAAQASVEKIGAVLATGSSRAEVEATLAAAGQWFEESTEITTRNVTGEEKG